MDKSAVDEIKPYDIKNIYNNIFCTVLLPVMLALGAVMSVYNICTGSFRYGTNIVLVIFTMAVLLSVQILKTRYSYVRLLFVLPFVLLLVFTGGRGFFEGFKAFLNMLILRWDNIHNSGIVILKTGATESDLTAFIMLISVLISFISWFLVFEKRLILTGIFCFFWILIQLITETLGKVSGICLLSAFMGVYIFSCSVYTTVKEAKWLIVLMVIFASGTYFIPSGKMVFVNGIRNSIAEQIETVRYGQKTFPEGDLNKAYMLNNNYGDLLTVKTEQEKNIYMHGFIGGIYTNGKWSSFDDSYYGGDYFGMLKWLSNRGFNPNTQVSYYYSLCDGENLPNINNIDVDVKNANRYYKYVTPSLNAFTNGHMENKKDQGIISGGIFGKKHYSFNELSSSRPSELMVADLWVNNPNTEEQAEYIRSEEVYRDFVYKNYLSLDDDVYEYVNNLFWKDYNPKNEGIYSLINHIRQVLKENAEYTSVPETVPVGEEPIIWFLDKEHEGNSMFFASAAAAAFRSYGIPARYAEGYFINSSDISSNSSGGKVNLTGEDAHAWTEVYFDGIGWLPVDATPGFYYDNVTLQQMVDKPDTIKKTAALKNSFEGAERAEDTTDTENKKTEQIKKGIKDVSVIILGLMAVYIILMAVLFIFAEIIRALRIGALKRKYNNAESAQKVKTIGRIIFTVLECFEIYARLGWETDKTDELISERFTNIEKGEYRRICALIEKVIYGGAELEIFEERTIKSFMEKLFNELETNDIKSKIKKRYFWIIKYKAQ